ncbi:MAG: DUF1822 family protein [Thainema sp.]
MNASFTDSLDYHLLPLSAIALSAEQFATAAQQCEAIPHLDQRWSVYLHQLALAGLTQWLEERAAELPMQLEPASAWNPAVVNVVDAVSGIEVNGVRLCVITNGQIDDAVVTVPRAVVDLPNFAPHAYVLVEVLEEQEQVRVAGYLLRSQLMQHQSELSAQPDWTYPLPLNWFDADVDHFLLQLRLGQLAKLPLPAPITVASADQAALRQRLQQLAADWQTQTIQPWDRLTWAEGQVLLQSPELLQLLYQCQSIEAAATATAATHTATTATTAVAVAEPIANQLPAASLANPVINVANWLRDRLDQVSQEFNWLLMPTLTPALGMRSTATDQGIDAIATALDQQGLNIPDAARGAYKDLKWGREGIRLYLITWPVSPSDETTLTEWTMLVVAGPHPDVSLPETLRVMVRDNVQTLSDQTLEANREQYLYAQVIGEQAEQFWVTVDFMDGTLITLPPLTYLPNVN